MMTVGYSLHGSGVSAGTSLATPMGEPMWATRALEPTKDGK